MISRHWRAHRIPILTTVLFLAARTAGFEICRKLRKTKTNNLLWRRGEGIGLLLFQVLVLSQAALTVLAGQISCHFTNGNFTEAELEYVGCRHWGDLITAFQYLKEAYKQEKERLFTTVGSDRRRMNGFELKREV